MTRCPSSASSRSPGAAASYFGTGSATVTSTAQELILQSGLPPLVREGDQYLATFTAGATRPTTASPADVSGSKTAGQGAEVCRSSG